MTDYDASEFLLLSGIQHFEFCERQWALIHIEQEWEENVLTIEGSHLHEKADDPFIREKRKDVLYVRGLPVHSSKLGLTGICDVVEFHKDPNGVPLQNEEGSYLPVPVEYKRGRPKKDQSDISQLVAQAICLEDMLYCKVPRGELFYHETRRRVEVEITEDLKNNVRKIAQRMHEYYARRHTPRVKTGEHCQSCSLRHICLPELLTKESVARYMKRMLAE
ncbi:CRISPR-associated protein Cas4 [Paenibacillus crassostreae]|uniref:CRISPR-associated exonuclease Cas4 n=1 Tax=Paenibacillus crassostreae TaxID=1763538 RepID=A0A167CDX6_9BACL|nr:CRISPR-associated protein Cas4 [Paenibacillus crassostreae]AOZ91809.1 CRISPR-associated protein Cas4 [Paenibacillus crassostreae]OAB73086.1 CRISPR-associated protein Cas4 [Paenibacillus crassostreae]